MENFSFKKPGDESGTGDTKQYFQLPTRKANQPTTNASDNVNMNFFKTYSGSSSGSTSSTGSSGTPITNYSSGAMTANNAIEIPKQETNFLKAPTYTVQHSLSDNNLKKREEPTAMFKKKSPYQFDPPPAENPIAPKKFMLSPKANTNLKMDFPKKTEVPPAN